MRGISRKFLKEREKYFVILVIHSFFFLSEGYLKQKGAHSEKGECRLPQRRGAPKVLGSGV